MKDYHQNCAHGDVYFESAGLSTRQILGCGKTLVYQRSGITEKTEYGKIRSLEEEKWRIGYGKQWEKYRESVFLVDGEQRGLIM